MAWAAHNMIAFLASSYQLMPRMEYTLLVMKDDSLRAQETEMPQRVYCPVDYGFQWTSPTAEEPMGWYKWDSKTAHKLETT